MEDKFDPDMGAPPALRTRETFVTWLSTAKAQLLRNAIATRSISEVTFLRTTQNVLTLTFLRLTGSIPA
jgi:hypothetical protein